VAILLLLVVLGITVVSRKITRGLVGAVEGTGSFGAGLTSLLADTASWPLRWTGQAAGQGQRRHERCADAARAAREVLARAHLANPAPVATARRWVWAPAGRAAGGQLVASRAVPSEAAFAMLAGGAAEPPPGGPSPPAQPRGDRQRNRALHVIAPTRLRQDPTTRR
jgi:hypothetical protein